MSRVPVVVCRGRWNRDRVACRDSVAVAGRGRPVCSMNCRRRWRRGANLWPPMTGQDRVRSGGVGRDRWDCLADIAHLRGIGTCSGRWPDPTVSRLITTLAAEVGGRVAAITPPALLAPTPGMRPGPLP